jgi:hypothetical protein
LPALVAVPIVTPVSTELASAEPAPPPPPPPKPLAPPPPADRTKGPPTTLTRVAPPPPPLGGVPAGVTAPPALVLCSGSPHPPFESVAPDVHAMGPQPLAQRFLDQRGLQLREGPVDAAGGEQSADMRLTQLAVDLLEAGDRSPGPVLVGGRAVRAAPPQSQRFLGDAQRLSRVPGEEASSGAASRAKRAEPGHRHRPAGPRSPAAAPGRTPAGQPQPAGPPRPARPPTARGLATADAAPHRSGPSRPPPTPGEPPLEHERESNPAQAVVAGIDGCPWDWTGPRHGAIPARRARRPSGRRRLTDVHGPPVGHVGCPAQPVGQRARAGPHLLPAHQLPFLPVGCGTKMDRSAVRGRSVGTSLPPVPYPTP